MRTIKVLEDLTAFDYLSKGSTYTIESMNGGKYDQIYFTNTERNSGTYLREARVKKLLREGSIIFID